MSPQPTVVEEYVQKVLVALAEKAGTAIKIEALSLSKSEISHLAVPHNITIPVAILV